MDAATGAGLELVFGRFLRALLEIQKNYSMFKPSLKGMEDMLKSMEPNIQKIEALNRDFDRPEEIEGLKELMRKGEDLVRKCSTIHSLQKPFYNKKLLKVQTSIQNYISTIVEMQQIVDQKETLFEVKEIFCVLREVSLGVKQLTDQIGQLNLGATNDGVSSKRGLVGVCSPPKLRVNPVGLEIPFNEMKKKLLDEVSVSLIVLSAPGGCGKTTLATKLCHDEQVKEKFGGNIFFVTVSKSANLLVIVERLFQHMGYELPKIQSEEDAVNQLEHLLEQIGPDPILLVLDDVWPGSESLLEKLKFQIDNYKILVTSRYDFPGLDLTYKLQTLNSRDAVILFRQSALPSDENSYIPDQEMVKKIVEACKGFPLAISVVGKSLCRKPAAEWRNRVKECSKPTSILSDSDQLLNCLQSSVNALDDKDVVKECYMDLGSFPEDQGIPATTLIDMWAELYNLDEDVAIVNLYKLSNRNLVDIVGTRKDANEDDGTYNEHFVKQHDLLRELSILQSNSGCIEDRKRVFMDISGNKIPEWWIEQKQQFISAKLLSICTDETFSSRWCIMQASEVEVLVLNFQTKNYTLPEFMERMDKLKALIVTNYGFFDAELSNFQLLGSLSNLKRIRLEKVSIPSFFLTWVQMKKLEKMSLVMCSIGQAFSNSSIKISNAFPNLLEINIDYCNDLEELPTGFCDLVQLNKLSITNCYKLSTLTEEIGKLVNLEVLRLNSCINLLELPQTIGRLNKLKILDLTDCLSMKKLPEQIGQLSNLRKLYMIDCSSCELPLSIRNLVRLKEVIGDEETASSWEHFKSQLPSLRIKVHKEINLNWLR